jgi:hypothetical protein
LPQFGVLVTNRLQVFMLDFTNGFYHVIDYVHFAGPDSSFNVNSNLADTDNNHLGVWDTNYPPGSSAPNGMTYGIQNQISYSKGGNAQGVPDDGRWNGDPTLPGSLTYQEDFFKAFFKPGNKSGIATNLQLSVQAPYSPTRNIIQYFTWQANDPLVHYLGSDIDAPTLNNSTTPPPGLSHSTGSQAFVPLTSLNLGQLNDRYMPWGGNPKLEAEGQPLPPDANAHNLAERDPLASSSDNWDFPTGKFPNVGWIGCVHRGTPWQTVYLKATDLLANNNIAAWQSWTGDGNTFDATNSAPVQDSDLFDLFTATPNGNAARGTLSVNQTHLAAWSALFSGLVVLTNATASPSDSTVPVVTNLVISPAGVDAVNAAVGRIVNGTFAVNGADGINDTRANTNLFPFAAFTHIGDILRVPAFTEKSPFLNGVNPADSSRLSYDISDELYEWLPQQTLGLLRVGNTPRYVVYCYGQTLRPAPNSLVLASGQFFGLCTNYQVTAESAARAVIRVDKHVTATGTSYSAVIESFNPLPSN